ncbi:hypothetical protein EOD08_33100 [Mesorhizobium sp. M6A.T.Ca.TU.002.02.2.1]|nr:hypothetical protein EOD08_33100 [Mesorhizobium sp. M6A.T.Ca.TU.002.02.2.1]
MTEGKRDSEGGLWPHAGEVSVSDADILADMIARVPLGEDTALTADSIYEAFVEAKKASDAWIIYYMISVALLLMAAAHAITKLPLLGVELSGPFIGPAAILYFSVCTAAYTNHELKMRLYRTFFQNRLNAVSGPDRANILLRYPLAFYGGEYLPWAARPKGFVVGWKHIVVSLPSLGISALGWLLAVFGLMALLGYALYGVYSDPVLPLLVKVAVMVMFFGSVTVSGQLLRTAKVKHPYRR